MAHRYHPDNQDPMNDDPNAIIWDECEDCAFHARNLGLSLDTQNWKRAWRRMLAVEIEGTEAYRSENEAALCKQLYYMYIALDRFTNVRPKFLVTLP